MLGPISRILLRYLAAALVTYGALDAPMAAEISRDPDVLAIVSLVLGAGLSLATEIGYALAKRFGWAT